MAAGVCGAVAAGGADPGTGAAADVDADCSWARTEPAAAKAIKVAIASVLMVFILSMRRGDGRSQYVPAVPSSYWPLPKLTLALAVTAVAAWPTEPRPVVLVTVWMPAKPA